MHALAADRVLARGHVERRRVARKVQVVGLDAARGLVLRAVGVDGEEEVGLRLVGDRGARLERDERVVGPRVDDLRAQPLVQQFAQPQRDIEHHVLLLDPVHAQCSGVVTAVAGVDHDPPNLQSQRTHQAGLTIGRLVRRLGRRTLQRRRRIGVPHPYGGVIVVRVRLHRSPRRRLRHHRDRLRGRRGGSLHPPRRRAHRRHFGRIGRSLHRHGIRHGPRRRSPRHNPSPRSRRAPYASRGVPHDHRAGGKAIVGCVPPRIA